MIDQCLLCAAHPLVHLNAALNMLAAVLLVIGYLLIKRGREAAHGRTMLAALAVSTGFMVSYLYYHYLVGHVRFEQEGAVKTAYLAILFTHIVLAAAFLPPMAILTVLRGLKAIGWWQREKLTDEDRLVMRQKHRRLARWTFPVWMYVSVTGVVIYAMLYHLWPNPAV